MPHAEEDQVGDDRLLRAPLQVHRQIREGVFRGEENGHHGQDHGRAADEEVHPVEDGPVLAPGVTPLNN